MKCPRCSAPITATPDEQGIVACSGCGAKLRTRQPAAPRPQASPSPSAASRPPEVDSVLARLDPPSPAATLPPGTPLKKIPSPEAAGRTSARAPGRATLEDVLAEVRALGKTQEQILALLKSRPTTPTPAAGGDAGGADDGFAGLAHEVPAAPPPVVRSRRRKTVLLIDDDDATCQVAVEALTRAEVPVRAVAEGRQAIEAIAAEKPDVIVMELGISGSMPGKDVINMIKATMEWVDIPIVLHTRVPIANQKEARTIHGADELVPKGPASPEALVTQVIAVFRRG